MTILKGGTVSAQMRKGFREGMSRAIQTLSDRASIKPAGLRLVMDLVLERVGGDGNPNAKAAAEIDASMKRGLAKAVAGRVEKQDKDAMKKFLAIGLKNATDEEARVTKRLSKASAVKAAAVIQKPTLQKRVAQVARLFRTVDV